MIKKYFIIIALLISALCANATTTLQFSISGIGATNFANTSSVATNGMRWGVIISSTNSTFQAGSYDSFDQSVSGFLKVGGVTTDDYYFANGAVSTTALGAPFFSGVESGNGGISTANNVPTTGDGILNVTANDPFGLIWLSSSSAGVGDKYGFFTNASFLLPASGIVSFTSPFIGADPIRSANYSLLGIPEPSRLVLFGFGCLCMLMRRNRK